MEFHGFCGFEAVGGRWLSVNAVADPGAGVFEGFEVEFRGVIHAIRVSRRFHLLAFDQLVGFDREIQLFSESAKTVPIWSIRFQGEFRRLVQFEIIENQGGVSVMAVFETLVPLEFLSREAG